MTRCRSIVLLAIALLFALPGAAIGQELQSSLEKLVNESRLRSATVGVVIADPQTGRTLASEKATTRFIPASNMKLLTTGAALHILGPDFAFETTLATLPPATPGGKPNLLVLASGDPAFADPLLLKEMGLTIEQFLSIWVDAVLATGITEFDSLVLDTRVFDDELVHPTWPVEQLNKWYCAEVSGLNFYTNVVEVFTRPTREREPPTFTVEPDSPDIRVRNQARSVGKGQQTVWAARAHGTNNIVLRGDVRWVGSPIRVTIHDTPTHFGAIFQDRLAAAGVRVGTVRRVAAHDHVDDRTDLHIVRSPLDIVLRRTNEDSQNLYAEALLKRVGHEVTGQPGSWANGGTVIRMLVQERLNSTPASAVVVADGSGMSRSNAVTPQAISEWLVSFANDPVLAEPFIASLAQPGQGTLRTRMQDAALDHQVYAKSGYLNGVHALSGYVVDPATNKRVVFSILINDRPSNVPSRFVHEFNEKVVELADEWLEDELARLGANAEQFGG
jgi:D-alanyl-D-alanine carboxypeptidase/D-alanyl-D-alanine-endopeptidase (penicillin-binding protein 4)